MSNSAVEGIRRYIKEIYSGGLIGVSDLADYCHESEGNVMKSLVKLERIREIRIITKYFCPEAHSMEEGSTYCSACDHKYPQEMIHSLVHCEPITITNRQYITDANGKRMGVILPIEEYEQLLEDLHDLALVVESRSEAPISLEKMKKYLQEDVGGLDETMKPDFETMARAELRTYVRNHADDEQAFHTYVDRFASTPTEVFSGGVEEIEFQVKKKIEELKAKAEIDNHFV